ncbi:putative pentatricopeptide repeat-containing protein At5g37570 isoform X1 [Chenopodium quinoa]|nr:putative pentatricopeptide repeat-containing protein At5g37570 isoform X1 [Chenopodium quinoa]
MCRHLEGGIMKKMICLIRSVYYFVMRCDWYVLLIACSHAALLEEGYCLFDMMSKYSINPSPDHYACMIDLLGRSGHLEAAYDLLKSLPIEAHAECWGALLEACRLHCDIELAEVVANQLVELDPHNAGNFVLFSNVCSSRSLVGCF